ncbi:MAG TPA: hypothetical protein VN633_16630 [Bryobacteraceae bacterium]|nr:hypothetical protein [Bryobacteraceae bacterium]
MPQTSASGDLSNYGGFPSNEESAISGVSWGAIIAGAFVAAALSLILLALGAGFGLLSISPWARAGASVSVITAGAIIWLIVIQILASGTGGYLAGRLRTKWAAVHGDEVYFRDTAHGLIVWAVAVVITAAFLGSATSAMVGRAMTNSETGTSESAYFVDLLFRSTPSSAANPAPNTESRAARQEATPILGAILSQSDHAAQDRAYLTQLVVARTGLNRSEAAERVSDTIRRARESADNARKQGARLLLWTFLALLIGAFCASYAATIGGRQRDHMKPV